MEAQADTDRIRLLLLQEHGLLRGSLARFLSSDADFEVVGECGSPAEALQLIAGRQTDVVISDFDLGTETAAELIPEARAAGYQGRFLILADNTGAEGIALAIKGGASGVFLKSEGPERLAQAIRLVASGGTWVAPSTIQLLVEQCINPPARGDGRNPGRDLNKRQQDVLTGILAGLTNRRIGATMGISESTVKNVLQGLFSRTGVRKRSQLVRLAMEGSLGNLADPERNAPSAPPNRPASTNLD